MNSGVIQAIRAELSSLADEKISQGARAFFKEGITCYGVKTATVGQMARRHYDAIKKADKKQVFDLCEDLLKSDYQEESFIAFDWAYRRRSSFEPADFAIFENWLAKYINNWAKCDTLCNHTIGAFVEQYPQYVKRLKDWALSDNRWLRRAAAVTLIIPARRGKFLPEVFDISDTLIRDKDDLVQKGYGWLLKEASHEHRQEVFDYVMRQKRVMPRTALRYAIEKMPEEMRRKAMEKA